MDFSQTGREPVDDQEPVKEPEDISQVANSSVEKDWFISEQELQNNPNAVKDKQIKMQLAGTMTPKAVQEQKPENSIKSLGKRFLDKIKKILGFDNKDSIEKSETLKEPTM